VHIYILGPEQLRWNFLQISQLSIRNFSADFWTFRNFCWQFREYCGAT